MEKIIDLICQVKFQRQYRLKMHVDYSYIAGIIGKRGQFVQKIRNISGAYLLIVFQTLHESKKWSIFY